MPTPSAAFNPTLTLHTTLHSLSHSLLLDLVAGSVMDALRSADAHVAAATHPRGNARWRLQRYNPLARLRWQKNKMTHPVAHQRAHTGARMNSMNPLYYLRRIKNNLTGMGRRRHTTTVL